MKLRAEIVVEIEAQDFVAAAGHQTTLEGKFGELRQLYPGAVLKFRQARERPSPKAPAPASTERVHRPTGALNNYEEL